MDEISCHTLTAGQINTIINHCAIIHEKDQDFGDIGTLNSPNPNKIELLPNQKIDMEYLSHFSEDEKHDYWQYLISTQNVFLKHLVFVT